MSAHFLNRDLFSVDLKAEHGRVVDLVFSEAEGPLVRLTMIPQAMNVEAFAGDKQISLLKPKTLAPHVHKPSENVRQPDPLFAEWLQSQQPGPGRKVPIEAVLDKKRRAIQKVREELQQKSLSTYRDLGELLVATQSMDVPESMRSLLDPHLNLADNIQKAFQAAKALDAKRLRTQQRLEQLELELQHLIANPASESGAARKPASPRRSSKKNESYQGRTLPLTEDVEFIVGRSAKDNLTLLRRSRAWDLWLHLKDLPGAHGILFRPKNKKIDDATLKKAAIFLIHNSGVKAKSLVGQRVDILVAECRYVRPIKGDRLGQVNYHSARTFGVFIES
jgi:predicted ribosome quality control (RQC) complex YloA/Tae2 family protein